MRRLACLLVPNFAAEAAVRAEPTLRDQAVVILGEATPARIVIEANSLAREHGVTPGMTEAEVLARPRPVICRQRRPEDERVAQQALLEVALAHSPRVEEGAPGLIYLDASGLEELFGSEEQIGQRLIRFAAASGLLAMVGIGRSPASARAAAGWGGGVTVVKPGEETAYLAKFPVSVLDLSPEISDRLRRWGIKTLGELGGLPPSSLFARLGTEGVRLRELARGDDPRPLRPYVPPRIFEESAGLDWEVDTLQHLFDMLESLVERVCNALMGQQLSADRLEWSCRLADRTTHGGEIIPAVPVSESAACMALLRASVESRPPRKPVSAITFRAYPVSVSGAQESLTDPAPPSPRLLTETLARLTSLTGPGRVGSPELLDSHRPDAVRIEAFRPAPARKPRPAAQATGRRAALALRRLRPPWRATLSLVGGRPVQLRSDHLSGRIVASAGPWRSSGEWWLESPWVRDEWDVELEGGTLCRLVHDGHGWWVEGIYD